MRYDDPVPSHYVTKLVLNDRNFVLQFWYRKQFNYTAPRFPNSNVPRTWMII